jgi:hypothetical protein
MVQGLSLPYLYLLQDVQYFKADDPVAATIALVCLGAFILIVITVNFIRNRGGGSMGGGGSGKGSAVLIPRKFSAFTMHRIANTYGLSKDQAKFLEYIFRNDAVNDPMGVIQNLNILDKHFKRMYKRIEKSARTDEDAQQRLALLFSIRNILETSQSSGSVTMSTRQISENMTAVLSTGRETYPVRVMSSKGDNIMVECPKNVLGTPMRIAKGTRVSLSFFTKSSKGFAFESRSLGMVDTPRGTALQLAHSGQAKPLIQRRYRRRQTTASCNFSLVMVEEIGTGRKKVRKMTVDGRRFTGTIMDVSIGGCSIRTNSSVPLGTKLKIEFDYLDKMIIAALGQVLRINRSGAVSTIMHIKFIKVPRKTLNAINALVYEYDED